MSVALGGLSLALIGNASAADLCVDVFAPEAFSIRRREGSRWRGGRGESPGAMGFESASVLAGWLFDSALRTGN